MWLLTAIFSLLTTNLIYTRALGTSTMIAAAKNSSRLPVLALLMTLFSVGACLGMQLICYPLGLAGLLAYPYSLGLPLVYTTVIGVLYLLVLLMLGALFRRKASGYKKYVHLSAFNCAVMGTLYLAFAPNGLTQTLAEPPTVRLFGLMDGNMASPVTAVVFGLQEGLGFLLAALMLSGVRERLYEEREIPAAFRGLPAVMVFIGIISMAVYAVTIS
ncbi:MAG: hypothetical protein II916_02725 [Oscillospiraceae bacterium]|nr:hypothetical protein [Oscillospiraceae bacterium]